MKLGLFFVSSSTDPDIVAAFSPTPAEGTQNTTVFIAIDQSFLDYELRQYITFDLVVTDKSDPSNQDNITVYINVTVS